MKWFRFYHDALDDPKVQRLPGDTFKFWVNLLCLASRSEERGLITKTVEDIAFDLRVRDDEAAAMLADLIARGLIEEHVEGIEPHNWDKRQFKSDNVAERVERHRAKQKDADVTLHETLHVTADETLKPSVNTDSQNYRDTEGINPQTPKRKTKSKQPLSSEQLVRFDRWYSEYPRKVHRAAAERAFADIDPDDELVDRMVSKTREWASSPEWTKDGGQYVPYPASWLNGSRWTDDSPAKRAPANIHSISGNVDDPIVPGPRGYTPDQLRRLAEQERIRESS